MTKDSRPLCPSAFRIEDRLVLPALNRIEREGEVVQIEPRVMQVLVRLAARPGEVLSRQELFDSVWAESVVCEEALTRTITELRRVFGDDTRKPRVIETIRKGGYRLIAPVLPVPAPVPAPAPAPPETGATADSPSSPAAPPPVRQTMGPRAEEATQPKSRRALHGALWSLAGLAVLVVVIWGARSMLRASRAPAVTIEATPLTSTPGLELFPALSPNGAMLAFSWAGSPSASADQLDLYVTKTSGGTPVRLTNLPGPECFPSWSPDGTEIAFTREVEGGSEICVVSVLGGEIRRIVRLDAPTSGIDWSPDGASIAFAAADSARGSSRIHLLRLKDLADTVLTRPVNGVQGDVAPQFSPDAGTVAFMRLDTRRGSDAWFVPVGGGEAQKVNLGGRRVSGVDWMSPAGLIVSASSKIDTGLWRVETRSGRMRPLAIPGGRIQRLSCGDKGRLAYEKISFAQSIWCLELSPSGECRRRPQPLIASTQRESEAVFSPDGRTIAFVSDRSGSPEIWIADADGEHSRRITEQQTTLITRPRWSPDGQRIGYTCMTDGRLSIRVADLSTRMTRALLAGGPYMLGAWSAQGDFIYYGVETAEGTEVWRVHPDGMAPAKIAPAGWEILGESPDGRGLLCARSDGSGIWLFPYEGGSNSQLVSADVCREWQEAVPADHGFFFTRRNPESSTLGFYDTATGRADSLATIEWYAASPALSPDRTMLLYDSIGKIEIDLMLAEIPR